MPEPLPWVASRLLREDGTVVVPADQARPLLALLIRGLRDQSENGARIAAATLAVLEALAEADARSFADESPSGEFATMDTSSGQLRGLSVAEAAQRLGCSTVYLRVLLRSGRVAGRLIGRTWLVDADHFENYARGRAA